MNAAPFPQTIPGESRIAQRGWAATLELQIAESGGRSILSQVRHQGPLRVQRAFYPEADGTCHVYLLHPPGGVVQGDTLDVALDVTARSRCLVTTPGATKIYRSEGATSRLITRIAVASNARCEWLPQECIVFCGAQTEVLTEVRLEQDASFVGWEVTCLGRPAAGERFSQGRFLSQLSIAREGLPLISERLTIRGNDPLLRQPWGLRGEPVFGTLVLAIPRVRWIEDVRAQIPQASCEGAVWDGSELEGISVFRALGDTAQSVRHALSRIWHHCRQRMGTDGNHWPRIWSV